MAEKLIAVLPGPAAEPGKVAFFEKDKAHPGGQAFIAGDAGGEAPTLPEAAEVAETPEVLQALQTGRLVRADAPKPGSKQQGA